MVRENSQGSFPQLNLSMDICEEIKYVMTTIDKVMTSVSWIEDSPMIVLTK